VSDETRRPAAPSPLGRAGILAFAATRLDHACRLAYLARDDLKRIDGVDRETAACNSLAHGLVTLRDDLRRHCSELTPSPD